MDTPSKKLKITGWALSALLALFLIVASAPGKFTQWEGKSEMFAKFGWTEQARCLPTGVWIQSGGSIDSTKHVTGNTHFVVTPCDSLISLAATR